MLKAKDWLGPLTLRDWFMATRQQCVKFWPPAVRLKRLGAWLERLASCGIASPKLEDRMLARCLMVRARQTGAVKAYCAMVICPSLRAQNLIKALGARSSELGICGYVQYLPTLGT